MQHFDRKSSYVYYRDVNKANKRNQKHAKNDNQVYDYGPFRKENNFVKLELAID
jgi:hypothetical protein